MCLVYSGKTLVSLQVIGVWRCAFTQGSQERVLAPAKKFAPPPLPKKGGLAKNLCAKSERLVLSCRVIWAWSEGVNLYSRQIMILSRKTKTYATF
jgi:hypothetical protein